MTAIVAMCFVSEFVLAERGRLSQRKRSLKQHLDDFVRCRQSQGITLKQLKTLRGQIDKFVAAGKWKSIGDKSASG